MEKVRQSEQSIQYDALWSMSGSTFGTGAIARGGGEIALIAK